MEVFWEYMSSFWYYQLFEIDGVWLTPGKIVIGLVVFAVGLYLASMISRLLVRKIVDNRNVSGAASAILQSFIHYGFVIIVCLIALQSAGVPITVFTIFGGALAIGIGFGSQNILNNFISGLILLFEKPMKSGDLIEIGSKTGVVQTIGARSTQLTDYRGVTHFIPNSHFLEQQVTNWHYNDDLICGVITIGVAYGSDVAMVKEVLLSIAKEEKRVVDSPIPHVLFRDFGNDALIFELLIWTTAKSSLDRKTIESDLRFSVDAAFNERGIVIAFPQRDVHLDVQSPIPVNVIPEKS